MDRDMAVYTAELLELILCAEPGSIMGKAREEFQSYHGTFGLRRLFEAERALRKEFDIPDSRGVIDIQA